MIVQFYRHGAIIGWIQPRASGGWRALTVSGVLSHHMTENLAKEALRCW